MITHFKDSHGIKHKIFSKDIIDITIVYYVLNKATIWNKSAPMDVEVSTNEESGVYKVNIVTKNGKYETLQTEDYNDALEFASRIIRALITEENTEKKQNRSLPSAQKTLGTKGRKRTEK